MKRFFLSLFGILFLLVGLILVGSGSFVAATGGSQGKISNAAGTAAGSGNALLFNDFAIDTGGVDASKVVEMTVGAQPLNGKPLFIGLGSTPEVINYLNDVSRDTVTGISSKQATVTNIPGSKTPENPAVQGFWLTSAQGAQPSIILPAATSGSTLVVMNQDGSPNVSIQMSVGVESTKVFYGAIAVIVLGVVFVILAIVFFRKSGKLKRAKQQQLQLQQQQAQAQAAEQARVLNQVPLQGQVPAQTPQAVSAPDPSQGDPNHEQVPSPVATTQDPPSEQNPPTSGQ